MHGSDAPMWWFSWLTMAGQSASVQCRALATGLANNIIDVSGVPFAV